MKEARKRREERGSVEQSQVTRPQSRRESSLWKVLMRRRMQRKPRTLCRLIIVELITGRSTVSERPVSGYSVDRYNYSGLNVVC